MNARTAIFSTEGGFIMKQITDREAQRREA
jgi:hypothetical protein